MLNSALQAGNNRISLGYGEHAIGYSASRFDNTRPEMVESAEFFHGGTGKNRLSCRVFRYLPFLPLNALLSFMSGSDRSPATKRQRTASADTDSEYLPFRTVSAICCLSIRNGLISQMFKTRGSILPVLDMGNR